ncbi:MAG: ribbon-helix-helix domain-containing protein [Gammaproteobacteria bacterium]
MCHIYAGTDPRCYESAARSIRIHGHVTSVRLENRFWEILEELAAGEGSTLPHFLNRLHDEVMERQGEIGNFASLLRVVCTTYLQNRPSVDNAA